MNKQEILQVKLNVLTEQDVNNMLPVSTYLIGMAFKKIGYAFEKGAAPYANAHWYVILKGDAEFGSVRGAVVFEKFKSFEEQPIETQKSIYKFFDVNF